MKPKGAKGYQKYQRLPTTPVLLSPNAAAGMSPKCAHCHDPGCWSRGPRCPLHVGSPAESCVPCLAGDGCRGVAPGDFLPTLHCISSLPAPSSVGFPRPIPLSPDLQPQSFPNQPVRPPTACKRLLDAMMRASGHTNPASLSLMRYRPPPSSRAPALSVQPPASLVNFLISCISPRRWKPASFLPSPEAVAQPRSVRSTKHAAVRTVRTLPCPHPSPMPITTTHATVKNDKGKDSWTMTTTADSPLSFLPRLGDHSGLPPRQSPSPASASAAAVHTPATPRETGTLSERRHWPLVHSPVLTFYLFRCQPHAAPGPKTVVSASDACLPAESAAVLIFSLICCLWPGHLSFSSRHSITSRQGDSPPPPKIAD